MTKIICPGVPLEIQARLTAAGANQVKAQLMADADRIRREKGLPPLAAHLRQPAPRLVVVGGMHANRR